MNSYKNDLKSINMADYVRNHMPEDAKSFYDSSKLKTGFINLDNITSLYPGLTVLGAISSLGKSTFVLQIIDYLAYNGQNVILFSLEQTALELAAKSLSRMSWRRNAATALTSLEIRNPNMLDKIRDLLNMYVQIAANITVVEGGLGVTINDIEEFVENYIYTNGTKPVVVIDYLQIILAYKMSTKEAVDLHVRRLKQLQMKHNLVLIVVSSFNRQNYMTQIDYESFKESGGIEYTADVVWGLQLQAIHNDIFNEQHKLNEKREILKEAKASYPRKIELVCLKNRFGVSSYSCNFYYYSRYDVFEADTTGLDMNNGFMNVTKEQQMKLDDLFINAEV